MKPQELLVSIISFTQNGGRLARRIKAVIEEYQENGLESIHWQNAKKHNQNIRQEYHITVTVQESRNRKGSLKEWCGQAFAQSQALVFVGAAGIAVRLIADFIKDKYQDPAVLVVDESGRYVIPILSGHVGGGNDWAAFLARKLGAVPVITTATDLQGKFAVDVFAAKNRLFLSDRKLAKEISAAVLRGEKIGFFSEGQVFGRMPEELIWGRENTQETGKYHIYAGIHCGMDKSRTLFLYPKVLVLGIGCRKGTSMEEIEAFIQHVFHKEQLSRHSICGAASVDLKQEEQGLLDFCRKWKLPFRTFSPKQLAQVPGIFSESRFVLETVGVGNVCERAAVAYGMELMEETYGMELTAEPGALRAGLGNKEAEHVLLPKLVQRKTAGQGITLAAAEIDWSVEFG